MKTPLPKGVYDIYPYITEEQSMWRSTFLWQEVEQIARHVCRMYGFSEIRTPVFEKSELFSHVGEDSDIVKKEMYTFPDRKGRSLTLRPEGTAAVVRSLLDHCPDAHVENKFYYILPMFRYERQQAGRYRQHHQFGVESMGVKHPLVDGEVIHMLWQFYAAVGLQHMHLHVNYLGGVHTRGVYNSLLKEYFAERFQSLSPISQERFHSNVLRILDSKEPEDQEIIQSAPPILNYLSEEDSAYFSCVLDVLKGLGISYTVNPRLVRGLDYYTDIVFEAVTTFKGHSYALGGGGRYDDLIERSGGPKTPSCGFGIGLERVIQTLLAQGNYIMKERFIFRLIPLSEKEDQFCFSWAQKLRELGIPTEVDWAHKKVKAALRAADFQKTPFVCLIGESELVSGRFIIKDMRNHQEFSGLQGDIENRLLYEVQNTSL